MPTFTFGAGVLAEVGDNARALGLRRVALFTDPPAVERSRRDGARSLAAAGSTSRSSTRSSIEPTDASFQAAAGFAGDGRFDGYVSVGGGSVIDTCKAANLYASTRPSSSPT